jgi:cellulose synthase/poly-beta-1,6-N-acetylglucosamine synthase-like glycosyltransferase
MAPPPADVTVLVPAFNEAASIAETLRSLASQTRPPRKILVIDDCSTDGTGSIARACGADVVRPPGNTGSKAGAQNFGLATVETRFTLTVDADTTLAPDAIEHLESALDSPGGEGVAAACGFVIPRRIRTVWERGRYIEYLFAFGFYKVIQDYFEKPLISSGCFSMYRTDLLRSLGGWSNRTMAEDMDLTWSCYEAGLRVRFVPKAVCFPLEPGTFRFLGCQLRRWSHGFLQNVRLHGRAVLRVPVLRGLVAVALWDAVVSSAAFLVILPALAVFFGPVVLLGYLVDLPAVAIPALALAARRRELGRAVASLPSFFVLRLVNALFMLRAAWREWIRRRPLLVYEKGH